MVTVLLVKLTLAISIANFVLTLYIYFYRQSSATVNGPNESESRKIDYQRLESAWFREELSTGRDRDFFVDTSLLKVQKPRVPLKHFSRPISTQQVAKEKTPKDVFNLIFHKNRNGHQQKQASLSGASDVYFSVRTTQANHVDRLEVMLDTWISLVPKQVRILTDSDDVTLHRKMSRRFGSNAPKLIATDCPAESHSKWALFCKLYWEYQHYVTSNSEESWFCHFDDDTYVNVRSLVSLLSNFDPGEPFYIGRAPSVNRATVTLAYKVENFRRPDNDQGEARDLEDLAELVSFHFALGGAGFCISKKLARSMIPEMEGAAIVRTAASIALPDDCVIGYVITHRLNVSLTNVAEMHSHMEDLSRYSADQLSRESTLSFLKETSRSLEAYRPKSERGKLLLSGGVELDADLIRTIHALVYS